VPEAHQEWVARQVVRHLERIEKDEKALQREKLPIPAKQRARLKEAADRALPLIEHLASLKHGVTDEAIARFLEGNTPDG
jgi:hypothetical protein